MTDKQYVTTVLSWEPAGGGTAQFLGFEVVLDEQHVFPAKVTEHPVEKGADITDHVRLEAATISLAVFVSNQPIFTGPLLYPGAKGAAQVGVDLTYPDVGDTPTKYEIPPSEYKAPFAPTPGAVFGAVTDLAGKALDAAAGALGFGSGKPNRTASLVSRSRIVTKQAKAVVEKHSAPFDTPQEVFNWLVFLQKSATLIEVATPKWTHQDMVIEHVEMRRDKDTGDGAEIRIQFKRIRTVESKITVAPVVTQPRAKNKTNKGAQGPTPKAAPVDESLLYGAPRLLGLGAA